MWALLPRREPQFIQLGGVVGGRGLDHKVDVGLVFGEDGDLIGVGRETRYHSDPVQAQSCLIFISSLAMRGGFRVLSVACPIRVLHRGRFHVPRSHTEAPNTAVGRRAPERGHAGGACPGTAAAGAARALAGNPTDGLRP